MNKIRKLLVTNFRDVRSLYWVGYSVRNYIKNLTLIEYKQERYLEEELKIRKEDAEIKAYFNINWTKDYKNLNQMLSIKGYEPNEFIGKKNNKYLVFSLTMDKYNSNYENNNTDSNYIFKTDIFYSVSLLASEFLNDKNNRLYKIIINKLVENNNLIKEGGILDIYYVLDSSKLEENIKESCIDEEYSNSSKWIPSIRYTIPLNNIINNNNKQLIVNIYIFSYHTFFSKYINTDKKLFGPKLSLLDRKINKLWTFPILIIEEMTLSTVTSLFKERGINLHGMSTTRRHKLSPLEKNLSNFLYITDLDDTIQNTHLIFLDKVYTNNKIDHDLYKELYKMHFRAEIIKIKLQESISNYKDLINNGGLPLPEKYNKIFNYRLTWLQNKYEYSQKQTINSKIFILLLRNQIFELEEKKIIEKQKEKEEDRIKSKNLLSLYESIELEIAELENNYNNKIETITKLYNRVKELELEVLHSEKSIISGVKELNNLPRREIIDNTPLKNRGKNHKKIFNQQEKEKEEKIVKVNNDLNKKKTASKK
jgi:hypothetical protein